MESDVHACHSPRERKRKILSKQSEPQSFKELETEFLLASLGNPCKDFPWIILLMFSWDQSNRFFVDDVPIRRYPRKSDATFPTRPMWVYGSIWDASSWATENGKYKADYNYQPFIARYTNFKLSGCNADGPSSCRPPSASPSGSDGLSQQQASAMNWVQGNYLVYDYCHDSKRDHTQTPEC